MTYGTDAHAGLRPLISTKKGKSVMKTSWQMNYLIVALSLSLLVNTAVNVFRYYKYSGDTGWEVRLKRVEAILADKAGEP